MPTIYDVARAAGVGLGTVSRVINNSPGVKPATREKVLAVIKEMGFAPHASARSLASKRTNTLGIVVPFFTRHFFIEVLRGIQDACHETEQDIILYNVQMKGQKAAYFEKVSREKKVDGLIVITLHVQDAYAEMFSDSELPVVLVDSYNSKLDSLVVDNVLGARFATEHLIELGHRRIAFINGLLKYEASRERLLGHEHALTGAGLSLDESLTANSEFDHPGGYECMKLIWEHSGFDKPTAVFAASDIQALGALEYLSKSGIKVPQEVSVIGYDDIELARYMGLTTIRQPMYEMGYEAVMRLKEAPKPTKTVFKPELIIRQSCKNIKHK